MFKILKINPWRQFNEVDITFHDHLTILTGANGSGKTTILRLLSKHFGWDFNYISVPNTNKTKGTLEYLVDIIDKLSKRTNIENTNYNSIGLIEYKNNKTAKLCVPKMVSSTYQIQIIPHEAIKGLHIPSHRPIYGYQSVQTIPTTPRTRASAFNQYSEFIKNSNINFQTRNSPNYFIKETLISLATFGPGNEFVESNQEAYDLFKKFESILKIVLPPNLGFEKISIHIPEVVLVTKSGVFSLDAVSGGIASLIDMAWQIFMYSPTEDEFVVTIDEPENHLHPELQRNIMKNFIEAFPRVQFIVATHNPFIVGSIPDSNVYVLGYNIENKVDSKLLDIANRAGTSNEILREVLGLSVTLPVWVENKLKVSSAEFVGDRRHRQITQYVI